jgi:hypothetical protein
MSERCSLRNEYIPIPITCSRGCCELGAISLEELQTKYPGLFRDQSLVNDPETVLGRACPCPGCSGTLMVGGRHTTGNIDKESKKQRKQDNKPI